MPNPSPIYISKQMEGKTEDFMSGSLGISTQMEIRVCADGDHSSNLLVSTRTNLPHTSIQTLTQVRPDCFCITHRNELDCINSRWEVMSLPIIHRLFTQRTNCVWLARLAVQLVANVWFTLSTSAGGCRDGGICSFTLLHGGTAGKAILTSKHI